MWGGSRSARGGGGRVARQHGVGRRFTSPEYSTPGARTLRRAELARNANASSMDLMRAGLGMGDLQRTIHVAGIRFHRPLATHPRPALANGIPDDVVYTGNDRRCGCLLVAAAVGAKTRRAGSRVKIRVRRAGL